MHLLPHKNSNWFQILRVPTYFEYGFTYQAYVWCHVTCGTNNLVKTRLFYLVSLVRVRQQGEYKVYVYLADRRHSGRNVLTATNIDGTVPPVLLMRKSSPRISAIPNDSHKCT